MLTNCSTRNSIKTKQNKVLFHWCCALEQILQRVCGVSILGNTQKSTGHGPGQPGPADPSLSRRVRLDNLLRSLPASAVL